MKHIQTTNGSENDPNALIMYESDNAFTNLDLIYVLYCTLTFSIETRY